MKRLLFIVFLTIAILGCEKIYGPPVPFYQERSIRVICFYSEKVEQERLTLRICETLRVIETNENYQKIGGSNEYGAYQFTKSTWDYWNEKLLSYPLDWTLPHHQDLLAYKKVLFLVEQNYSPSEIAAIWNCGEPDWRGRKGINRYGVPYNVPYYVYKFERHFYTLN